MKSVTLLFPSAKARLRGPLQPKPSFQHVSSSEQANTSEHTERGPVFSEPFIPAEERWWEAPAGAGLLAVPGHTALPLHSATSQLLTLPPRVSSKAQKGADEGKRHNLIGKKKGILHILSQLCRVSLYKSRDVQAHQLFPHSSLLKIGLSHKAKHSDRQGQAWLVCRHCIRFIWRQKIFLHWALTQRRTRNPTLLNACIHFPTLRLKLQMLCLSCTAEWHPTAFPHQPPSYSGLITPSQEWNFRFVCLMIYGNKLWE